MFEKLQKEKIEVQKLKIKLWEQIDILGQDVEENLNEELVAILANEFYIPDQDYFTLL